MQEARTPHDPDPRCSGLLLAAALGILAVGGSPRPGRAQEPPARPATAAYVGAGNHYGWLGAGGELYLGPGFGSVFAGLGLAPQGPTLAGAGGVRSYVRLAATTHRLFADVSVSLMRLSRPTGSQDGLSRTYGVGVTVGYSYLGASGVTAIVGGGVGATDLGADFELLPVLHAAIGWTWSR